MRRGAGAMAVLAVAVTITGLAGCSAGGPAEDEATALAGSLEEACEAGADEGTVRYWISSTPEFVEELKAFNEIYPDIEVEAVELGGDEATQRLLAEDQAGRDLSADAVEGEVVELLTLAESGLLEDVSWTDYGVSETREAKDGLGVRTLRSPIGIAYNTDLYAAGEVPDTYADLVDPALTGRIGYDPRGDYFAGLAVPDAMGLDDAKAWFDELVAQTSPVPVEGSTASLQAVAAGQIGISTNATIHNVNALVEEGAPLEMKFLDIVAMNDSYGYLVKGSPNANATACFLAWWSSDDASDVKFQVEGKRNVDTPEGVPADATIVTLDTQETIDPAAEFAEYIAGLSSRQ